MMVGRAWSGDRTRAQASDTDIVECLDDLALKELLRNSGGLGWSARPHHHYRGTPTQTTRRVETIDIGVKVAFILRCRPEA
ncbi:hypothetical protein BDB13_5599 [Rhodococcus sp. OK302]|nr:hypothetical protein BDB13_5599 [Rhodococcus sp. OK302]